MCTKFAARKAECATARRPRRLGLLHPPFSGDQIFEQHRSATTFKYHFDTSARDRLSPPFVVDAPDFADRLNDPTHLTSRIPHPARLSVRIELDCDSKWCIQRPKSVGLVPRSAFRVPRWFTVHNRSTHTAARGDGTRVALR